MTNEHTGTCIYDKGRFELRETDKAIIDLKGDFPPIMIASNTVDDGSEPNCADKGSVLHLLNELSDNNPNEKRHWYLKKMLDKAWTQYHELKEENEQLKSDNKCYVKRYSELFEDYIACKKENEQLKQTLKDSYINEICENCKYGHYYLSDNFDGGFEGDFECLKKHFDNEHWKCDGLKECDDFELDFKGDVE